MKTKNEQNGISSAERRRRKLDQEAQRLQRRLCLTSEIEERLSDVYRRMSNIKPDAFVVICKHEEVAIHGLSHSVSRGIEANGLEFYLEKTSDADSKDYLVFGPSLMEGMRVALFSGQQSEIILGGGSFPTCMNIFFESNKKKALAFAREERAKRNK